MRRGVVIAFAVTGLIVVILAIALSTVGSDLDQARIERDDLQLEVDDLHQEVDTVSGERDQLKQQAEEQGKALEQFKAELDHPRAAGGSEGQASGGTPESGAANPAPTSP